MPSVIWSSSILVVVLYTICGLGGGVGIHDVPDNFLAYLSAGHLGLMSQVTANLFSFFIIGLGIPLFQVVMRYNLVHSEVVSPRVGVLMTSVLPWGLSWMVYQGHGILEVFTWSGLCLNGLVGFMLPVLVSITALGLVGGGRGLIKSPKADIEASHTMYGSTTSPPPQPLRRDVVVKAFPSFLVQTNLAERRALIFVGIVATFGVVLGIVGKLESGEPDE